VRKRLLATSAVATAVTLIMATDAQAAVLWDGNADKGVGVFATTICSGGTVQVKNWSESHGNFFEFAKPAGVDRCEGHSMAGAEGQLGDNKTLWFGWSLATKAGTAQAVFQWKSNGTNDQHQQNYPILLFVEDNQFKAYYIAPGEKWTLIGSTPWTKESWHKIELGITTSSGNSGSLNVYMDGSRIASRTGVRTWDDLGNKPRWGTYRSGWTDPSQVWVDDPKMGTSRVDVD
jgi:hypothetical protein